MRNLRTWKEIQTIFTSSSRKRHFNSLFKKELSDSRGVVRTIVNKDLRPKKP